MLKKVSSYFLSGKFIKFTAYFYIRANIVNTLIFYQISMATIRFSFTSIIVSLALLILASKVGFDLGGETYTLQTMVIILIATIGGAYRGMFLALFYLWLGNYFPVFNGAAYGDVVYNGNTAGYLFAFPFAALLAGHFKQAEWYTNTLVFLIVHLFILTLGGLWLWQYRHLDLMDAWQFGMQPYLWFAGVKSLLCGLIYYSYLSYEKKKIQGSFI
jgi:biotin transport system substrate-specific component